MFEEPRTATPDVVRQMILEFDESPKWSGADRAVEIVFRRWPGNTDISEILAKVTVLNGLFGTNILDTFMVADHIRTCGIDERLSLGDRKALIDSIASVRFRDRLRTLYSFATKYCSWQRPDLFQMYDGYVHAALCEHQARFGFAEFKGEDLRDYDVFAAAVESFRAKFGLHQFSRREMDKFLWLEGRRLKVGS